MFQRFLRSDMFKILKLLEALDLVNVKQGKPTSIILSAVRLPNIVDEANYEDLNKE